MRLELNIGLGNNPYNYEQALALILPALEHGGCSNIEYRQSAGEYQGTGAEQNIIMRFNYSDEYEWLTRRIKALSTLMNQECIALYIPEWEQGDLLYPDYWAGERYNFSLIYFERF